MELRKKLEFDGIGNITTNSSRRPAACEARGLTPDPFMLLTSVLTSIKVIAVSTSVDDYCNLFWDGQ